MYSSIIRHICLNIFCYFFDKHWFWRMLCRHQCSLVEAATQTFLYGLAWTLSHVAFQRRIAVIGMQLNSTWIQIELTKKWSDYLWEILLEEVVLTMHSGIAVSNAILFLVCKSNHFQLTHRHSKHSVFFQCFASCGVSLPLCVNSVQSYHESHFFICIKFNDLLSFPYKKVDVCYKSAFDA